MQKIMKLKFTSKSTDRTRLINNEQLEQDYGTIKKESINISKKCQPCLNYERYMNKQIGKSKQLKGQNYPIN